MNAAGNAIAVGRRSYPSGHARVAADIIATQYSFGSGEWSPVVVRNPFLGELTAIPAVVMDAAGNATVVWGDVVMDADGNDVALEVLTEAWRSKRLKVDELNRIAKKLRVQRVMQPYLENDVM